MSAGARPDPRPAGQVPPDVVVVGAGAAGCALAHRLSDDPTVRVLLLEAGPDERPDLLSAPARWPETAGSDYDHRHRTVAQRAAGGRQVALTRGRVLGGSTCLNAMVDAVPGPTDLDGWGPGWSFPDLAPALTATAAVREAAAGRALPHRGDHPLCADFVAAAGQAGHRLLADGDPSGGGAGWFDLDIAGGQRLDAARTYLHPVYDHPGLTVWPRTTVTRIELAHGRVVGLQVVRDGSPQTIPTPGEVVLCAGAIGSPTLLLRSGIGPRSDLETAGLSCLVDSPGVGADLHDHPLLPVVWSSARPVPPGRHQLAESFLATSSDPRTGGLALSLAFAHVAVTPPGAPPTEHGATALVGLYRPRSRGRLSLEPTDPDSPPRIDPGYLTDPHDLEALVGGVEIAREVAAQPALAGHRLTELFPGPEVRGREALRAAVRQGVGSYGHLAGSCAIGPAGVVEADLRVRDVDGLRVADASVVPTLPTVAPSVTVQAIGWRAGELITAAVPPRR